MVILGSTTLGQAGPCAEAFATARAVAAKIFRMIDEVSHIYDINETCLGQQFILFTYVSVKRFLLYIIYLMPQKTTNNFLKENK